MKKLVFLCILIIPIMGSSQLTESEGTLRISSLVPKLELWDNASSEDRLEASISENSDRITLKSHIGPLELDSKSIINFKKDGNTLMTFGGTRDQLSITKNDIASGITDSHLELISNSNSSTSSLIRFENKTADKYGILSFNTNSTNSTFTPDEDQFVFVMDNEVAILRMRNLATGSDVIEVNAEIVPANVSNNYDIGNNNSNEHWDDVVADDFINFSDKRLKKNIAKIPQAQLNKIMKLNPVTYQYIEKHNQDGRNRIGFIAQEVKELFPSCVVDEDIDINENGDKVAKKSNFLSLNYIEFIPILTKGIQEQQKLIKTQQNEIEKLNEKIKLIISRFDILDKK